MLHKTVSILHNVLYTIAIGAVCAEVAVMGAYEYHQYFGNTRMRTPIAQEGSVSHTVPSEKGSEAGQPATGAFNSAVIFAVSSEYQSEVYPEI